MEHGLQNHINDQIKKEERLVCLLTSLIYYEYRYPK